MSEVIEKEFYKRLESKFVFLVLNLWVGDVNR